VSESISKPLKSLVDVFADVKDPRIARSRLHPIENVLAISLLGAIAGAEGWDDLAVFAKERTEVLGRFLDLTNGVPSADTFRRVFEALSPSDFHEALLRWVRPLLGELEGQTIALDGKTLRGALARSRQQGAFHLLHVWATEKRLLLAQAATDGAGSELPTAIELLRTLDLAGATVTADANFCASELTKTIRDRGGHYVLALKGNRGAFHRFVEARFEEEREAGYAATQVAVEEGRAHGRDEVRVVRAMPIGQLPEHLRAPWCDLKTIVQVERVRVTDSVSLQRAYYITSHPARAKDLARRIRDHWKIENELHYCLDVTFGEDRRPIRSQYGAENFALVTRFALSLLKKHAGAPSTNKDKQSVRRKKKIAMWSDVYFLTVLTAGFPDV
jgi:predicted transposase YbfD/YdcC